MPKEQIDICIVWLENVRIALSQVEVKGENNLNLLLASIQTVRKIKNKLKGSNDLDDHDE